MLFLYQLNNQLVHLGLRLSGAGKTCVAAQVLIGHGFQCHHIEFITHTVTGYHGAGQFGSLLNIIGCTGGNATKCNFFGSSAACVGCDLILNFFLGHQVVIVLLHLHGIAQSAGGSGNNSDLLNGSAVGLQGCHQRMANFMVCNSHFLLVGENGIFLLIACDDHLNGFFQVCLSRELSAVTNGS